MSSSNNDEEYKWPESGNAGPDVEWEHVPIEIPEIPGPAETPTLPPISPGTEDQGKDAGDQTKEDQKDAVDGDEDETKEDQVATKEDEEIPTVEEYMKQEEAEQEDESLPSLPTGSLPTTPQRRPNIQIPPSPLTPLSQSPPPSTRPKMKVSTLERYYPSPQEVKETFPENLDELFEKHGDDLIIQDDENGKAIHIFFLFGEKGGKKHYRCITKGCNSYLLVTKIPKPECPSHSPLPNQQKVRTPKGKEEKEEAEEDPKEGGSKEDHKEKEDVKEEEKGAKKKKRKPKKKKSNKNKKEEADEDPKEGCSKEDQKVMKVMKVQSFSSKGIQKLYK